MTLVFLAALIALAPMPGTTGAPSPAPVPLPSPTSAATSAPTGVPTATAPSSPTPAPTTPPSPAASPTANPYTYRFVPRQPAHPAPGQPQIFAVYLNAAKLHSRGQIRIKVETSPEVVKVVSRSNGREGVVPLVTAGDFEAASTLPKIPFIAVGMSVDLEFIATGADGRKVVVRVPVKLDS